MLNLPRRHFLPWDRPLLPQAAAFLAADWTTPTPLDLSRTLVLVPTRQSGRRLREALAAYAAERGSAVFPPRVLTPEAFITEVQSAKQPSRLQRTLAWVEVLQQVELGAFRDVFPVDPPARNFTWALRLADQFVRLQTTLAENQLTITDVAGKVAVDFPETERWAQLAELERLQFVRLAAAGFAQPGAAAEDDAGLAEFDRVVLVATVDPLPAALSLLGAQSKIGIDVLVFASESLAADFDAWGRPLVSAWTERVIDLPAFEHRVHLCADPSEQAARIAALAEDYCRTGGSPAPPPDATGRLTALGEAPRGAEPMDGYLAIGIADPEIAALIPGEAARRGIGVFNPEGERRREGALYHLLLALGDIAGPATFEQIEALARCPDFLAYLEVRYGRGFSAAKLLHGLDALRRHHLPADLAAAQAHANGEVAHGLTVVAELRKRLSRSPFPQNYADVLAELFRDRVLDSERETDAALQDAATAWTAVLRECADAAKAFTLSPTDWRELALRLFGESRHAGDKPAGVLEMQGWLEALFEAAPHLVVAGCNDGLVPEAVTEDPFLPESLRTRLGLRTNAARFARDAYMLQAIAACRTATGRLDLLVGRASSAGDPLRPSRLLLRCPDEQLPDRVDFLFRTPAPVESHLPWMRAWRLHPRVAAPLRQIAVTSLRRWLACPFRFYLQYALKMDAIDATKSEMDAFDFGTLCHAALEAMGRDAVMRDCTDAGALREFLLRELTRHAAAKFGADLALPLLIQIESARQRLGKFAEVQARDRAEGWVIQTVEQPFAVEIAGLVVKGKVDRIDRHQTTGAVRVLDYKTSDSGVAPRVAHIRPMRSDEDLPEWATVAIDGKTRAWADLQLPLYRHALAPAWGSAITLGYATLPKAVSETTLFVWDDYTPELHSAAMRCAEGVCAAIGRGEFWPPNEAIRADHDDFATLFHHGVAASVEWQKNELKVER